MAGKGQHAAVVGGGLVGSLQACFLAKRGFKVDLYEGRPDIRLQEVVKGRSINMALSRRGRDALKAVGAEESMVAEGIPMHARMIHNHDGTTRPIPYGRADQFIMSIDRRKLNEVLLTTAEKYPNITLHFEHKLLSCDFAKGECKFQRGGNGGGGEEVSAQFDLIVGADGAYSAVRKQMMKGARMDYSQEYIPHGYMELHFPPTNDNRPAMAVNYLHIWPRDTFMMIGLPNPDKSFTGTLFMPFEMFESIKTEEQLMEFFRDKFPDSIPLLGEKALKETYFSSKALPMVTVKCFPWHKNSNAVIIGDAAHAMVPFYGQGMNCGFEDCLVFDDIMDKCNNELEKALPEFSKVRSIDAHAMCDLAMFNYIEMRSAVNSKMFLFRKKLDNFLYWLTPNTWIPLYTMVSFTRTRYHLCIKKRKWQDEKLQQALKIAAVGSALGVGALCIRHMQHSAFWRMQFVEGGMKEVASEFTQKLGNFFTRS